MNNYKEIDVFHGIIYMITNLKNGKIYIGQTIQELMVRWSKHVNHRDENRRLVADAIDKHGVENFKIEMIDWATNWTELNYKEWLHIKKYDCIVPNGYNLKDGGRNGPISQSHKDAIGRANTEREQSPETRAKISKANKGRKHPEISNDTREILSNNATAQWENSEIRAKMIVKMQVSIAEACGRKVVNCCTGEVYSTIAAAEKAIGMKNLAHMLSGTVKTAKGYIFKYLGDWDGVLIIPPAPRTMIYCISNDTYYASMTEVERILKIPRNRIKRQFRKQTTNTSGYKFRYLTEEEKVKFNATK